MTLVIGGAHQGQREFALAWFSESDILFDLHELLRDASREEAVLARARAAACVTCDEVGSGVIPMGADQREWRERVGHACQRLAREADCVVRMYCGIPMALKGALE